MARLNASNASWLAGLLVVFCAALWLLQGLLPKGIQGLSAGPARISPMDMPDWYRIPLARGAHYTELGAVSDLSQNRVTRKKVTVRGY